ncbi:hypothetical protein COLO4_06567 [Corchorus olitorius]|uniref:Uncharacterized protein n=1 Tax=Corchorus olitorius TaxID=93759 RepID=A0A1R3KMX4_9ROSI|nr:hypothetical protein COLO4_06567 [Corchorus olitorius]
MGNSTMESGCIEENGTLTNGGPDSNGKVKRKS